jgi:long-chain acyl-CoA synthetase
MSRDLAAVMHNAGLAPGDRIAILLPNDLEWEIAQQAAFLNGAIVVGIEPHATADHVNFVLTHAGVTALVVFDQAQFNKVNPSALTQLNVFLSVRSVKKADGSALPLFWNRLEKEGPELEFNPPVVKGDAPAILVYSSGSTGTPKGILYTHRQLVVAVQEILKLFEAEKGPTLCWLPMANLFQRILNFWALQTGSPVAFVEDPREVLQAIKEVKPVYLIGVPRFYEKVADGIRNGIRQLPLIKRIFVIGALRMGRMVMRLKRQRKPLNFLFKVIHGFCDKSVLTGIRSILGGRIKFLISGSAPISPHLVEFFLSMGIPLLEAYGCSENIVPVAMNRLDDSELGTVGRPLDANTLRIADDGEIQIKGPGVFEGYYNDPDGRARFTADGYYCTGDIGIFTKEGHLKLLNRKSEIIFTSTGRKILPTRIEGLLNRLPHVETAVVFGNNQKALVALFTFRETERRDDGKIRELREALRSLNQQLASYERVETFAVLERSFSTQDNEITLNGKIRRSEIEKNHQGTLRKLYQEIETKGPLLKLRR